MSTKCVVCKIPCDNKRRVAILPLGDGRVKRKRKRSVEQKSKESLPMHPLCDECQSCNMCALGDVVNRGDYYAPKFIEQCPKCEVVLCFNEHILGRCRDFSFNGYCFQCAKEMMVNLLEDIIRETLLPFIAEKKITVLCIDYYIK